MMKENEDNRRKA
jgi:hypothetical protein